MKKQDKKIPLWLFNNIGDLPIGMKPHIPIEICQEVPNVILNELMLAQQEVINSPIRFNGVSIERIKDIFAKYGYEYKPF